MPFLLTLLAMFLLVSPTQAEVLTGIDRLAQRNFDLLQGKRVGLITNQTGRARNGRSTIDLLATAPGVQLVALFSPEHGIRGNEDVKLPSGRDSRTGLPIHSLYGATCRPTPAMLAGLDLLVFDIQDIGSRFYTYIGTLHHALRAAKEQGIPLVVLDRPNPLGGVIVSGATPEPEEVARRLADDRTGCRSLTVTHPIPTRHGMTAAELARMINLENRIGADLQMVPLIGWQRRMLWNETGLSWVNPSPNMRDPLAALLYPGFGILEAGNLSVGRGTERPFHYYGAPWVDPQAVLRRMPQLPGFRFSSASFTPTAPGHPYRNMQCHGIEVTLTDETVADPILAGLHLTRAIYQAHPDRYRVSSGFHSMTGDRATWQRMANGVLPEQIVADWRRTAAVFETRRLPYLLY